MGLFWTNADQAHPVVVNTIKAALAEPPPPVAELDAEAEKRAAGISSVTPAASLNTGNLVVAIVIVAVLIGAAIGTDAANLPNSSKALYALATTAFGIVVGFLTGEKPKT